MVPSSAPVATRDSSFEMSTAKTDDGATTGEVRARARLSEVTALRFSGDGRRLAVGLAETDVVILDEALHSIARLPDMTMAAFDMAFSPDGRLLVVGGAEKALFVFDASTGKKRSRWSPHPNPIASVAFSPSGRRVATVSSSSNPDTAPGEARVWNVDSGEFTRTALPVTPTVAVGFSGESALLAWAREKTVELQATT